MCALRWSVSPLTIRWLFSPRWAFLCEEEEEGRIYPMSRQAASVLDALRLEAERLGVIVQCDTQAEDLQSTAPKGAGPFFRINGALPADAVILACGGKASPQHGSDGSGYGLLRALHIPVTEVFPSLVQITTEPKRVKALKGMRVHAEISLSAGRETLASQRGEINSQSLASRVLRLCSFPGLFPWKREADGGGARSAASFFRTARRRITSQAAFGTTRSLRRSICSQGFSRRG